MVQASFNLERMQKNHRRYERTLNILVAFAIPVGLGFIAMALTAASLSNLGMGLIGLAVFVEAIPIALCIRSKLYRRYEPTLRESISRNLHEHGLLALVLQDDSAERLPSLMIRQGPYMRQRRPPKTMQERLDALAGWYPQVCREAGLTAYPVGYYRLLWGLQIAGQATMLTGITLQYSVYEYGQMGLYSGILVGVSFIIAGILHSLAFLIDQSVTAELIAAMELQD